MASDLLAIGRAGALASRTALDVTAQNIANAASEGYVRRSVALVELSSASAFARASDPSLSGVRVESVVRNADLFRQAEVRRTGADAARAGAEVAGLENVETAIEQAGVYPAIVQFEGSLQQLAGDPVNPSLRAAVVEDAGTMARTFNIAAGSLAAVGERLRFEASDGVDQVNALAEELARVNLRLSRAADAQSDQASLLDQRDLLLQRLSGLTDLSASIAADKTVRVRLGGTGGPLLVDGGTPSALAMTQAANGTIGFTLGGSAVSPSGGALAGKALALDTLATVRTRLDGLASGIVTTVNTAQTAGVALDGSPGVPLFTGSDAASIALGFSSGALLATAPAGAGPSSRNPANLAALRQALGSAGGPAMAMDALLFDVSSAVAGRRVTRDALATIADTADIAFRAQAGVDLDQEATNLIRYQQAFEASGRVMQVSSDIFDSLLAIR